MRHLPIALALTLLPLFTPGSAKAWNKSGHMVTGALAYHELKAADPQALSRVIDLLKQHPWYEDRWLPAIEELSVDEPEKHDLYLFMYAARWPDDIRDDPDLHCDQCHYINFPFKPANEPASVHPRPPSAANIVRAFGRNMEILRGDSSDAVKAMAVCWIFHLVGDVHQPLHTSALFTSQFPQGDRGGTRFFVRVRADRSTISLHKLWDGLLLGSERFRSVNNRAGELRARAEFRRTTMSELAEQRFSRWAKIESFDAAKLRAYRNGGLQGSADKHNGSVLPQDYVSVVQPIAERRAMLAGYRLADILKSSVGS